MAIKPTRQRIIAFFKKFLLGIFIVCVLGVAAQIWLVQNAKSILKSIVAERSGGRIKLELSKVRFNFFLKRIQINQGELQTTDTATATQAYRVKFNKLSLKIKSLWPLLISRNLLLDSINIQNPDIKITQLRLDTATNRDASITEQMGLIYNSTLDVLKDFGIRRILVNNASLQIANRLKPTQTPVLINNIHLNILRNPNREAGWPAEEEVVELTTNHQSISLPNGRHHLAFKKFKLELLNRRVELDSCTITAKSMGSSSSSYDIFFNKVSLVGVDFIAMGTQNLIRADSVYCESPNFNISLAPAKQDSSKKKLDPKKIIREFTSDLDLGVVSVQKAGIHLNLMGKRRRIISNSNKDNFEIRGLRITADSAQPVSVKRFDLLARDYHLYNADSSAIFSFDSVHFVNNKVLLNNFSIVTAPSRYNLKSNRDFKFPFFELTDLDWYQLFFNQTVVAKEALLIDPRITYTRRTPPKDKKTDFFSTLENLDSLMALDRLKIVNGNLSLNFGQSTTVKLSKVNLQIMSNRLLAATNQTSVQRSVNFFSMARGILFRNDLKAELVNVTYKANNLLFANKLLLKSSSGNVNAQITEVYIDNMFLDDRTETIFADGIEWNSATLQLKTIAKNTNKKSLEGSFDVKNIRGKQTAFTLTNGVTNIVSSVMDLKADLLTKTNAGAARAKGVVLNGNTFKIENEQQNVQATFANISIDSLLLADEARDVMAGGIQWNDAAVKITKLATGNQIKENAGTLFITDLRGLNTRVTMKNGQGKLSTRVTEMKLTSLQKNFNAPLTIKGVLIKGEAIEVSGTNLLATATNYQLSEQESSQITGLAINSGATNNRMAIQTPLIKFKPDINSLFTTNPRLFEVSVTKPIIDITKYVASKTKATSDTNKLPFTIDKILVTKGLFNYNAINKSDTVQLTFDYNNNNSIAVDNMLVNNDGISFKQLMATSDKASFNKTGDNPFDAVNGTMMIRISDAGYKKAGEVATWQAMVNEIDIANEANLLNVNKENKLTVKRLRATDILLNNIILRNPADIIAGNSSAKLQSVSGNYSDSNNTYTWYNVGYIPQQKSLSLDSLNIIPRLSLDSFISKSTYQKDYLTFRSGQLTATGFALDSFSLSKVFIADTITMTDPMVDIYRDKFLPREPYIKKLLPAAMLQQIKTPLSIQNFAIVNGKVRYTERHKKSGKEGTIELTKLNGNINNITNVATGLNDTLSILVNTLLMNEAPTEVIIAQSYGDTAGKFKMSLHVAPTSLTVLNPVIGPLSNVKILSGKIDSLQLDATADDHFAAGSIVMPYKKMKIRLLNWRANSSIDIPTGILNLAANVLLVRNKRTTRPATVYFKRIQNKSFFNYLVKIAMNGLGTSIGFKSNGNNIKEYKKELRHRSRKAAKAEPDILKTP